MAVPPSESVSPQNSSPETGSDSALGTASDHGASPDETLLLSSLKELVASGDYRLDAMLDAIADAARRLTGASGAALATWKDGAMVCRARSGGTAPALGAQLNSESGISGECLRTGKLQHCPDTENNPLVDAEVCRSLGLRSIAALPLEGWRGTNGILEIFSNTPGAFNDHHLALLSQLAALAERARASRPHGASPLAASPPAEEPRVSNLLPASDRLTEVAFAFLDLRSRPLLVGAIVLAAVLLFGFVIWLGWRGPRESGGKAQAAVATSPAEVKAIAPLARIPDNDPVWKPNPGGEPLFPLPKTSAATPVKLASKVDAIQEKKAPPDRSLLAPEAANIALPRRASGSDARLDQNSKATFRGGESVSPEPPPIAPGQSNAPPLNAANATSVDGVLEAKASFPVLSAPVSQGISGGELVHRVAPVYPTQAKTVRLEGRVILSALVMEDGRVGDLKVVAGNSALARAAMDAVKQWQYKPFLLDGKPTRRETTVTIDFKLSSDGR